MGNPKDTPRDFEALERRRLKAVIWFHQGLRSATVARRLKVHRQSTSRWYHAWRQKGIVGLRKSKTVGRRAKIKPNRLKGYLNRRLTQKQRGKSPALSKITELVRTRFGVSYHKTQIARLLGRMGFCYVEKTGWQR